MNAILKQKHILYTFAISFTIMTLAFAVQGLYPFGEQQIMIIDSWHQYYPILQQMHDKLINGGSLLYSWETGAGTNFWLMMGYYAMSPLNLLSILVPVAYLREFMLFATILKIALAGTFFSIYLRSLFKRDDLSIVSFGLFYSFCAFLMGYYWDIMWLDCVALLPLVILGLHGIIDRGAFKLFVITLALTLISNFYIAYFVCEFIAIYFFVIYFMKHGNEGLKHFLKKLFSVGLYSIMGIGLSAVTVLPIIYGMGRAYGRASANPTDLTTYHALLDILNNMLSNVKPTIVDGLPNVQSGLFVLIMAILYFSASQIPTRAKILNGGLLSFLFLSLNINVLNFVWHGFHFPNQVPFRFAFLISFVIITIGYEGFLNFNNISKTHLMQVLVLFAGYLLICEKIYTTLFDFKVFYVTLGMIGVYLIIMLWYKNDKITRQLFLLLLLIVAVGESSLAALNATSTAGHSGRSDYPTMAKAVGTVLQSLEASDKDFYRVEMHPQYSANDPLLYGYRGVSQFSSTANSKLNYFAKDFGVSADPGSNSIHFLPGTPVANGMFSVKYILDKSENTPLPNAAYEEVSNVDGIRLLKNRFAMPLGYRPHGNLLTVNTSNINPFTVQTEWLNASSEIPGDPFINLMATEERYTNMERTSLENEMRYHYRNVDPGQIGKATILFTSTKTQQYYAYMLNQSKTATLNNKGKGQVYETPRGVLMDLGIVEKGKTFDLTFEVPAAPSGFFDIAVVSLDETLYTKMYEAMIDESLVVNSFDDTHINATITSLEHGSIITSIPYEPGWKAKIDGIKVDPIEYKDAFLMLPITKGEHQVSLTYTPQGFTQGLFISLMTLMLLGAWTLTQHRVQDFLSKMTKAKTKATSN